MADDEDNIDTLEAIAARMQAESERQREATGHQLPLLPPGVGGLPHSVARSSMFTANKPGRKKIHEMTPMGPPSKEGVLLFSGHELNQADLDVVLEIFHRYAGEQTGKPVKFSRRGLLNDMGKGVGNSQYQWLMKSLDRLSFALLKVETDDYIGTAGILKYDYDPATEEYSIIIDRRAAQFLSASHLAYIDLGKRKMLPPKDYLAKYLQGLVSSHKKGLEVCETYKVLQKQAGQSGRLDKFKNRYLPRAFAALKEAGVVEAYRFSSDRAYWKRA